MTDGSKSQAEELDIAFASAAARHADAIDVFGDALTPGPASYRARGKASSARDLSGQSIICPRFISSDNSLVAD
jgi:hypothetical protein